MLVPGLWGNETPKVKLQSGLIFQYRAFVVAFVSIRGISERCELRVIRFKSFPDCLSALFENDYHESSHQEACVRLFVILVSAEVEELNILVEGVLKILCEILNYSLLQLCGWVLSCICASWRGWEGQNLCGKAHIVDPTEIKGKERMGGGRKAHIIYVKEISITFAKGWLVTWHPIEFIYITVSLPAMNFTSNNFDSWCIWVSCLHFTNGSI